ncbi:MAG: class IV adenylate cyclase [Chloroflexi bacterium]|nr:class IV adenylate cyclase [Chloroflexota bacterium]
MPLEIEAKIYIPHLKDVKAQLSDSSAEIIAPRVHEKNQLFLSPYQDFKTERIVLRLRQDEKSKITYKSPAPQDTAGVHSRVEIETTVGDYEAMDELLQALGYTHGLYYEKYRTIYHFESIPDADIMLDELPFGNFIEVEGTPDAIEAVLEELHLTDNHRLSTNYAGIFEAIREHQQLSDINHIAFDAFDGVEVDGTIFEEL